MVDLPLSATSSPFRSPPPADPLAEGARARAHGRPKDSCPYPGGSAERTAWLEAYDGIPAEPAPDGIPDAGRGSGASDPGTPGARA